MTEQLEHRFALDDAMTEIRASQVWEIPTGGYIVDYDCPLCDTPIITGLSYQEIEKIKTWTVAQLMAWHRLQERFGIDPHEMLEQTSYGDRPGIGAMFSPSVLGVSVDGIFYGIEPDGYTHS